MKIFKKKILVKIKGGLGNQMFQYAYGRALANHNSAKLILDICSYSDDKKRQFLLNNFNINSKTLSCSKFFRFFLKLFQSIFGKKIHEREVVQKKIYFNTGLYTVVEGYFLSENFFNLYIDNIKEEIKLLSIDNYLNDTFLDKIKTVNSVSIHFRRGDYVYDKKINSIYEICSNSYYIDAINYIRTQTSNEITVFIFSDDLIWVKKNFPFPKSLDVLFVDSTSDVDQTLRDFYLMSSCKHNIISNSTFSWWAAWLNSNPEKVVVAPKKWFKESSLQEKVAKIIPQGWKVI